MHMLTWTINSLLKAWDALPPTTPSATRKFIIISIVELTITTIGLSALFFFISPTKRPVITLSTGVATLLATLAVILSARMRYKDVDDLESKSRKMAEKMARINDRVRTLVQQHNEESPYNPKDLATALIGYYYAVLLHLFPLRTEWPTEIHLNTVLETLSLSCRWRSHIPLTEEQACELTDALVSKIRSILGSSTNPSSAASELTANLEGLDGLLRPLRSRVYPQPILDSTIRIFWVLVIATLHVLAVYVSHETAWFAIPAVLLVGVSCLVLLPTSGSFKEYIVVSLFDYSNRTQRFESQLLPYCLPFPYLPSPLFDTVHPGLALQEYAYPPRNSTSSVAPPETSTVTNLDLHESSTVTNLDLHESSTDTNLDSATSALHVSLTNTDLDSATSALHEPSTDTNLDSAISALHEPSTDTNLDSATSPLHEPSTDTNLDSATSALHESLAPADKPV